MYKSKAAFPSRSGAVLGVDIGWSETRKSSAACLLEWAEGESRFEVTRFTAKPDNMRRALINSVGSRTIEIAALDGPLRGSLDEIGIYRDAERVLTRKLQKHIGKPGQSSSGNGRKLNNAANAVAMTLLETGCMAPAKHQARIHASGIVEAFPTSFLGVLLESGFKTKGKAHSDSYYEALTQGSHDGQLGRLLRALLPARANRTPLSNLTNHDDRAAVVCALTALCAAARSYVAVGGEDGFIVLPAREQASRPGLKDWAWHLLEQNLLECPSASCVMERGSAG
jgi:predicted RNase H-like nuclease